MGNGVETIQRLYTLVLEGLVTYGFQILSAVVILFIGIKLAGWLAGLTVKVCKKYSFDLTLTKFAGNKRKNIFKPCIR